MTRKKPQKSRPKNPRPSTSPKATTAALCPVARRPIAPRPVEDPLQYPAQAGRRIKAGVGSVRDREEGDGRQVDTGGPDDGQALTCGAREADGTACGRPVTPRSIRPGAVLCPWHRRDAVAPVVIHRGTARPTTPDERQRLQAKADADRSAALVATPEPGRSVEQNIKLAKRTGALKIIAARHQAAAERAGAPIDDSTAFAMATADVTAFGRTTPKNLPHEYTAAPAEFHGPGRLIAGYARLGLGRPGNLKGRRVRGSGGTGTSGPVGGAVGGDGKPNGKDAKDAHARKARLQAQREAARFRGDAGTAGTDRQREAHVLVRIERLSKAEAGRRMGINRQSVADLLWRYDKAVITWNPTPPLTYEGD